MSLLQISDEIRTERLALRPYSFADAKDVFHVASDPQWSRFLPLPKPYLPVHAEQFIATQVLLDRSAHRSWAILFDGQFVGGINVRYSPQHRVAELGYSVRRERWGQGFATEAVSSVVAHVFNADSEVNRFRAMADSRNVASQRVLEKSGFLREGTLRQNRFMNGDPVDEVWFGLLRSEWTK
jgi:RimJ/RimL family protein N-acetyltransferase